MSSFWRRLADSPLCELVELFGNQVCWPQLDTPVRYRDRVFGQWQTFWIFVGQVLSHSQSCCEALRKAQAWLWLKGKKRSQPTHRPIVRHAPGSAISI